MKRLEGKVQPYAWGSTDFIPALLGVEPTGEPQAELWLGAHTSAPALVDGQPLDEVIAADPKGTVGEKSVEHFGPLLPYLLKVLSASKPLSLQAHPTRAQAEAGFGAEQEAGVALDAPTRTYRDDWPKPEMLCALVKTQVLCGFREPAETYALFEALGVPSALELVQPLRDGGAEGVKQVFRDILRLGEDERAVVGEVVDACGQVDDQGDLGLLADTAQRLGGAFPDDPGVLGALLMNRVTLEPGQATFLGAGNLHAYLEGSAVEIMANSDNVLRGGLTSKFVNVEELLKILDFTSGFPGFVPCTEGPAGVWSYQPYAEEFALWRLVPEGAAVAVPRTDSARVVLVTEGEFVLESDGERLELKRGQSAFLATDEKVTLEGRGNAFVAGPGIG